MDVKNNDQDSLSRKNSKASSRFKFENETQNSENNYETVQKLEEITNNELTLKSNELTRETDNQPKLPSANINSSDKEIEESTSNENNNNVNVKRKMFVMPVPRKSKFFIEFQNSKNKLEEETAGFEDNSMTDRLSAPASLVEFLGNII